MSGETFNDAFMLEIFRAEVETHVESLTSGLLALERDPSDTSHVDEMMRGAHSIKGAARIVGIDPAVRVAHVMEDGFIAAQNGKLTLQPEHVDVLLRGVDLLNRIANASKDPSLDWEQFKDEASFSVAEISDVLSGKTAPATSTANSGRLTKPAVASTEPSPAPAHREIAIPFPAMFDSVAAEQARVALIEGLDSHASTIRFDLTQTNDLDAIGLAFLAAVPAFLEKQTVRAELIGCSDDLHTILAATGIDRMYSAGGR